MKLSVFTHSYMDCTLSDTLDIIKAKGIDAVEVGAGGLIGKSHCDPQKLLADADARKAYVDTFTERGMGLSALSAHGNPLHPNKDIAEQHTADIKDAVALASQIGVKTVVTFSGCPGGSEASTLPNWPVSPWPLDFQDVLQYQWEKKLVPFWKDMGAYAADHGVNIALELHGGFSVHTPATMARLRDETGQTSIGANVDPSHLWWQGIDPAIAIRHIGEMGCLFYFHAKDTRIEQKNVDYYGLTDMQSYANVRDRAWQFRTIGYGHDIGEWANIISTLRLMGYDDYVSIEHEDALMSSDEGLNKAITNMRSIVMTEPATIPKMFDK